MENFEIKGIQLGILKYLSFPENSGFPKRRTFGNMYRFLNVESREQFDVEIQSLRNQNFISIDTSESTPVYTLETKGKVYMEEFNDFEQTEIFAGKRDYVILKFLYLMGVPVYGNFFPDSILIDIPEFGKGMDIEISVRAYIDFDSSLKKFVSTNNQREVAITSLGKKYFEFLMEQNKKDLEILNKPLIHYDLSTHSSGPGSTVIAHSNVDKSLNKNTGSSKLEKKGYNLNKRTLLWTIISVIVAIILWLLTKLF
jgi:hypothetical protein